MTQDPLDALMEHDARLSSGDDYSGQVRPEPVVLGSGQGPPGCASAVDQALADMVVHRLFVVGLMLQSAASPASDQLTRAVEELDAIIRDVRSAVFEARSYRRPSGDGSAP